MFYFKNKNQIKYAVCFLFIVLSCFTASLLSSCQKEPLELPAIAAVESDDPYKKVIYTERPYEDKIKNIYKTEYWWNDEGCQESLARIFLDYLVEGDYYNAAVMLDATDPEAYKFITNVKIDSYEIVEKRNNSATGFEYMQSSANYFLVKLSVSEGDGKYFTVGESYWDLITSCFDATIMLFSPSQGGSFEKTDYYKYWIERQLKSHYCYLFSLELSFYQTASENFNKVISDKTNPVFIHGALHFYGAALPEDLRKNLSVPYPIKDFCGYYEKYYGITGLEQGLRNYGNNYDPYTDTIEPCAAHGGTWLYPRMISEEYDTETGIYVTVIDYCSDTAFFVTARTMKYKYKIDGDGVKIMLSTELLYNSGGGIAIGTI